MPARCVPRGLFFALVSGGVHVFRKYLASESLQLHTGLLPGVRRQQRFAAGFLHELLRSQAMFHGHLRKQKAALRSAGKQQTMAANFHFL